MPTSNFFQNYFVTGEQTLLQDLVDESIRIFGLDCYYITRTLGNFDQLLGGDDQSIYSQAFFIEVYLKTTMGFAGDRDFMSKVAGLEIRDQVVFSVSQRQFNLLVGQPLGQFMVQQNVDPFKVQNPLGAGTGWFRPQEGDLIYFPLNRKCFQIKYVNKFESFYQLGQLYTWDMTAELFEYSDEVFNTGIPDIDRLQQQFSTDVFDYLIKTNNGTAITFENGNYWAVDDYTFTRIDPLADNDAIQKELPAYIDWSETDPFSQTANAQYQVF